MTSARILLVLGLAGCQANGPPQGDAPVEPLKPQPAVAVVGQWLRVGPSHLKGDTLFLYGDSSAQGIVPWPPNKLARISRWKVRYMSKDPGSARQDWRHGYTDGGDDACMRDGEPGCVGLPALCLGVEGQYLCEAFALTPDSLVLARAQYIRLTPIAAAADFQLSNREVR